MLFPSLQRILLEPLDSQLPTVPAVRLLLTPAEASITGPCLLLCVITIVLIVPKPRNAELLVPGRETSSPAGGCLYPTCQTFNLVSFNLPTGFSEFKEVSHPLWCLCLCIRFSCSKIFIQLFRSKTTDCRWFISLMLVFSCYSSTIRESQVRFQLAPVAIPILGADFLKHYNLLLDVSNQRVFSADSPTSPSIVLPTSTDFKSAPLKANLLATPKCISDLLAEFPDVISSDGFMASKPRHSVTHHLLTQPGPPVFAKSRRLDPEKLASAKKEFSAMEKAGIIRRSNSPWSSPLHMVKKKDGGWRPCGDYRRLNTVTVPDRYLLPNIADFTSRIPGLTIFSKLDLLKGYYQVPMAEEDICKTAIITPFGMFEFLHLPFGLRNAGNTFQRMMDSILGDLPYCFTYVDDILVFSSSLEEHVEHLHQVLLLCRQHGLTCLR